MTQVSELKIVGKLDIEQIKVGLNRVKADISRTGDEAKKSFFEFNRMKNSMADAWGMAKKFGIAALGALTAISLLSPSLKASLATLKPQFMRIAEAIGKQLAPQVEWLRKKLEGFANFLDSHPGWAKFIGIVAEIGVGLLGLGWIVRLFKGAFKGLARVFKRVGKVFSFIWLRMIKPVFTAIGNAAKWLWGSVLKPVVGWIGALWSKASGFISGLGSLARSAGTGLGIASFLPLVFSTWKRGLQGKEGSMVLPGMSESQKISGLASGDIEMMGFQSGGYVPRTGLAMVHEGETVIPRGRQSLSNNIHISITTGAISKEVDLDVMADKVGKKVVESLELNYR